MAANAFIQFTGGSKPIEGESLQIGHEGSNGWFAITDWSWDIEAETNFLKGTGAAIGKPSSGALSFTHTYDKSSPVLMQYIVKGTHFAKMVIHMLKQTGNDKSRLELYFQLNAKDVFVTKVSSKGSDDGAVTQDVEVVFKAAVLSYKPQNNTGGTLKAPTSFVWNIAEMNQSMASLAAIAPDWPKP